MRQGWRLECESQSTCVIFSDLIENPSPCESIFETWVWMAIFMRHPPAHSQNNRVVLFKRAKRESRPSWNGSYANLPEKAEEIIKLLAPVSYGCLAMRGFQSCESQPYFAFIRSGW